MKSTTKLNWSTMKREIEKKYRGYLMEAYYYSKKKVWKNSPPLSKFLILCFPRTGSNQLVSMLNSHPQIHCDNELLMNRLINPMQYINCRSSISQKTVYGFKLQAHHLALQKIKSADKFVGNLFEMGYKIIKLTRRNYFRAAISLNYAATVGKFHYKDSSTSQEYRKIYLDPQELYNRIEWIELQDELIAKWTADLDSLSLVYEDDLLDASNQQVSVQRILNYLDLPYIDLKGRFIKMKSEDLRSFLINSEEIRAHLSTTRYAHFIEESP